MKENLTQPTTAQLEAEVARVSYRSRFGRVLRSTIYALVIVAAVAVLIATLWLPILQIYGTRHLTSDRSIKRIPDKLSPLCLSYRSWRICGTAQCVTVLYVQ